MSDFSDRPFVAGSLIGLRAFAIDSLGRLLGPTYRQVFKPGENEAECRKPEGSLYANMMVTYNRLMASPMALGAFPAPATVTFNEPRLSEAAVEKPKPAHALAGVSCQCGFYAYFDGGNDYGGRSRVTAVIEGYGVCTVGTRGFRASKAKLLALVEPKRGVNPVLAGHLHRNYPEVPFYGRKRDALADFPLSTQHVPSPEDEDFWTRPAAAR
jgi:hypothetical protein